MLEFRIEKLAAHCPFLIARAQSKGSHKSLVGSNG